MHRLKYLAVYVLPLSVYFSFTLNGLMTFFPVILNFGIIPFIELFLKPDDENMEKKVADDEKNKKLYDWILYLSVPVQLAILVYFLFVIQGTPVWSLEFFGRISSMGMMCGILGLNVGHELGHRLNRGEQFLGEIMLLTSLNTHFLPYHNGGHHRNVATEKDAATAAKNQWLFSFWFTSQFRSYAEAWKLENKRMKKQNKSVLSLNNRMVAYSLITLILLFTIWFFFNFVVLLSFVLASIVGILLLETVNYIEHYGLLRKKSDTGIYEQVRHQHSWNSDHPLGRLLLFNLSRHSDHHYNGSKKYQILDSLHNSPQMPTGYPGMMIMATIPPLWFWVMNKKVEKIQ